MTLCSSSVGAVAAQAAAVQPAGQNDKDHGPDEFTDQTVDQLAPLNLADKNRRREVCHVLKRHAFEQPGPERRQQIERKHLPGHKETNPIYDVQEGRDLQKPEADHADGGLEEETDRESQKQ